MNKPTRLTEWIVWGGLFSIVFVIAGLFVFSRLSASPLPVLGQVTEFKLTNQFGEPVTLASLRGQVWVADVIFTRCPIQCLKLTKRMSELQAELPSGKGVRLVSLTADPEFDTPPVLKRYAERFGASDKQWLFLTGEKQEINRLAISDLKFVVMEKDPAELENPNDLFIHSSKFVLVDKHGRIRGWYDGEDPANREKIVSAVKSLLRERQR